MSSLYSSHLFLFLIPLKEEEHVHINPSSARVVYSSCSRFFEQMRDDDVIDSKQP